MKEKIITLNKSLLTVLSMMFFIILAFNENVFAADSDIVNIPDAEFKALLNEELGVEDTTADITKGQLATITEIVFERDDYNRVKNIKSITGIEYCNNLTRLDLMNCYELTDISPIKGLTNLYSLSLRNCTKISDISHIKDLTQITYLDLYNCTSVSDISVLKYLTKLGWVELYNTKITNISSLENLTKLYIISLSCCTELESISPLKNKPNL